MTSEVNLDLTNVLGMTKIKYLPNFSFLHYSHGYLGGVCVGEEEEDENDG